MDKYLDKARTEVKGAFVNLDQRLKNLESNASGMLSLQSPITLAPSAPSTNDSPQANFAYYHFSNAMSGIHVPNSSPTPLLAADDGLQAPSGFGNTFQTMILPIVNDFVSKLGGDIGQLLKVFRSGSVSDIIKFFVDLLSTLVDSVGDVVDILLVSFGQIISQIGKLLDTEFDLPVLSALYEFVTELMGEEETFSVINGFSFVAAVAISTTLGITGQTQLPKRNTMGCTDPGFPAKLEQAICGQVGLRNGAVQVDGQRVPQVASLGQDSPKPSRDVQQYSLISGQILNISNVLCAFANGLGNGPGADQAAFVTSVTSMAFGFPIPSGDGQPDDTWKQRIGVWAASSAVSVLTSVPTGWSSNVDGLFAGGAVEGNNKRVQGGISLLVSVVATGLGIEINVREHSNTLTWFTDTLGNLGSIGMACGDFTGSEEVKVAAIAGTLFGTVSAEGAWVMSKDGDTVFKRIVAPF